MWLLQDQLVVSLGPDPIPCVLALHHDVWVACGGSVHTVSVLTVNKAGRMHLEVQRVCVCLHTSASS